MKVSAILLIFALAWNFEIGQCAKKKKKKDPYRYLMRYGYISSMSQLVSHAIVADKAIRKFQRYAHLPVTGKMDRATKRKLIGPRCGSKDFGQITNVAASAVSGVPVSGVPVVSLRNVRKKRYVQQGSKWRKETLTWSLHNYPALYVGLSRADVDRTLDKAFKMWQSVAQLNFQKLNNNIHQADIVIMFQSGLHNDPYPFDGRGGTLAHGFYPGTNYGLAGDIHFDDDETWSLNGQRDTTDFLWTSLHEIGHAIGLEHSEKIDAIMWPWFEGYQPGLQLRQDDISGIQSIYGARPGTISCPATNERRPKVSTICNLGNFNDVLYHKASCTTYFFRGHSMWRMDNGKKASNRERISSKFPGLPGYVDAAYSRSDGSMVFFKYDRYWIYDNNFRRIVRFARLSNFIKNSKATGLDRIDAAMVWDGNSRVYFFRKDKYWRYNEARKEIDPDYPKSISVWRGVKSPVDAVFSWKKSRTFFLNGYNIDKFHNDRFSVKKGRGIRKFIKNC